MYVIERIGHGGGWVRRSGHGAYTHVLSKARTWPTLEEAERERNRGTEVVRAVSELMR